jgi:hypothetical protein
MVRAKFQVQAITETSWGAKIFKLAPMYDTSIEEDRRYSKATPSGSLEMQINNPPAAAFFELGKSYYIDFTKAD